MVLVLSQHPCNWARILVRSILFLEIRIVRPLWRRRSFQPKLNPLQSIPITLDSNHPIIPDTAPTISSARRCIFWNPSPPIWQSISNQFYSVGINCFAHNEIEHLSDLFSLFSARFSPSGFRKWLLWHLVQSIPVDLIPIFHPWWNWAFSRTHFHYFMPGWVQNQLRDSERGSTKKNVYFDT